MRAFAILASLSIAACGDDAPPVADGGADMDARTCLPGTLECECAPGGTCNDGQRCEGGRCVVCPPGSMGCACDGDDCDGELVCMAGLCAPSTCELGAEGCPCDLGSCDVGLACVAGMCAPCSADTEGCPCAGGACGAGLVCDVTAATCRMPLDCADLVAAGTCAEHQICEVSAGEDARCPEAACETGWRWVSATSSCVECVSVECLAEPNCDEGMPGSLLEECEGGHRRCEEDADDFGMCTTCDAGYSEIGGACIADIDCGGRVCGAREYCDTRAMGGPICRARPCADPLAAAEPGTTDCSMCPISCSGVEGSTGRIWPFRDGSSDCLCETLPGYYIQPGGDGRPTLCDADEDGWVRDGVRDLSRPTADPARVANMRCTIRSVDRVDLVNDMGQTRTVLSCSSGLVTDAGMCTMAYPLRLLETERNDVPGRPGSPGTDSDAYRAGGRAFAANELNALTKACRDEIGDYDDDGIADAGQVQTIPIATSDEEARLAAFSHFIELHTVHYEPPVAAEEYGALVIAERSRCSPDFPIRYDTGTAFDPDVGSTYWRTCERRRDPTYDAEARVAGFDFAQFAPCTARTGSCDAAPVPASSVHATFPDPATTLVRDHGACGLGAMPPLDGYWRGMNHHSQFRCVRPVGIPLTEYDVELARFAEADGDLRPVACRIDDCSGACPDTTMGPHGSWDPNIVCPRTPTVVLGEVGFAAVRYRPYTDDYAGGCVNEDVEWPNLCPAPEFELCGTPPTGAFGRYRCHGADSSFLWSRDDETAMTYDRPSLLFADEATGVAANGSVWAGASFCP